MSKKHTKQVSKPNDAPIQVNPVIVVPPDLPFYYVNHIEVNMSPFEFAITCGRMPAKLSNEQIESAENNHKVYIEPTVQLLIPAQLIDGLIKVLQTQKEVYDDTYRNNK